MQRHFLYLTNTRLVSMVAAGKRIVARREFAVSGAGAAEFERHLADHPRVPAFLLTDLMEEDFRLDTVPHVGARDREAILGRKLAQIFRGTPYRHAEMQGREAEGRRDDRVIYTAITNPEILRPWLEAIERLRVPLEGVYSAAVFSGALLEELDLLYPHALLVTFTPGGSMRQSYFRDSEIKFSRLTPVDLEEGQTLGAMVAEETTRTWQYLDSLRNFGPEDRLEVCVLLHASERPGVQPELRDFAQIQYRLIDMGEAATRLALRPPPLGSSAEEMLVHLFLMRPPANHFASSEMRRHATLRRTGRAINRVSAGVLAAGIAFASWNLLRAYQGGEADARTAEQLAALNREYEQVTRAMPAGEAGGATMRDAVSFYNIAIKPFPEMPEFVGRLSRVLLAHPQVRLAQLSWLATDDPKAMPALAGSAARASTPVRSVAREAPPAAAPAAADSASNPPFAGGRYEVALLEATLRVAAHDFRGALDQAQELADDIGRLPGFRADVIESPLDVRPSAGLQGRHGEADQPEMETRFVVRVVRDRGGAA